MVALGSALGLVPFGPIWFGPAGALFVGLALGALDDRLGEDLGLARTIGLAPFVYTVGLSSGSMLIRAFRRQLPLMAGSAVVLAVVAVGTVLLGRLLELGAALQGGVFAGVGTSTPTPAAATAAAGSPQGPGVGGRVGPDRPDHRGGAAGPPGRGARGGREAGAVLVLAPRTVGRGRRRSGGGRAGRPRATWATWSLPPGPA